MKKNKILSLAFLLFLQLIASGQSITLTLDSISSNTNCNDIWTEQNLDLSFVIGTSDDCGAGACYFDVEPTYVWLYPSRLSVDLSGLQNIQKVEIDVISYCSYFSPQCTFSHLMDSTGMIINTVGNTINNPGNSINGTLETIIIENPTEGFLSELAISSCEGNVHEIRIYQNILSTNQIELDDRAFAIYPNPVIDMINIDVSGNLKYEATIYDLQGRIMISTTNQSTIDIQTLTQGTYLIKITDLDSGQNVSEKIIIE
jgi:hypothetical protein|tara:strand:+ start:91 stop:864 length:774 start_codon:yes stop_codon:yes gene_type:complete